MGSTALSIVQKGPGYGRPSTSSTAAKPASRPPSQPQHTTLPPDPPALHTAKSALKTVTVDEMATEHVFGSPLAVPSIDWPVDVLSSDEEGEAVDRHMHRHSGHGHSYNPMLFHK